jgi:hypothetical protein
VDVVTWEEDPGAFDACALSSGLPFLRGAADRDDVRAAPYLRSVEEFRPLPGDFRVGIRWAGYPGLPLDRDRSTELPDWAAVLETPGVSFYSLQKDDRREDDRRSPGPMLDPRITDLGPELTTWSKTAAAMMQMDLIISVDTSVAHLAGALGRPVWILLSAVSEWRWGLESADTPWYDSARLFRQRRCGQWPSVLEQVASALQEMVGQRGVYAA